MTRPYRGVSADDRRAERRARLQRAVLDLLAEEGIEAVTIRAVSDRAGLTRRYFYQEFADVDALLVTVFDQINADVVAALSAGLDIAPEDPRRQAEAALRAALGAVIEHPGKARLIVASTTSAGTLAARRADASDAMAAVVRAYVQQLPQASTLPERLVDTLAVMTVGGVTELVARWLAGTIARSPDELIDDLAELIARISTAMQDAPVGGPR